MLRLLTHVTLAMWATCLFERHAWAAHISVTSPWAQWSWSSLHSHMVSLSFLQMFSQRNDRGRHSSMAEAGFRGACAEFHVAQLNTFRKYDERANFSPGLRLGSLFPGVVPCANRAAPQPLELQTTA